MPNRCRHAGPLPSCRTAAVMPDLIRHPLPAALSVAGKEICGKPEIFFLPNSLDKKKNL
jgi:hypothetical protein